MLAFKYNKHNPTNPLSTEMLLQGGGMEIEHSVMKVKKSLFSFLYLLILLHLYAEEMEAPKEPRLQKESMCQCSFFSHYHTVAIKL